MIDPHFSRLQDLLDKEEVSRIAVSLGKKLKEFVRKQYVIEENTEARLGRFFFEVSGYTGEHRDYGADYSHEHLVDNWRKGRSTRLALAAYFYLGTLQNAQPLIRQTNEDVFGTSTIKAAKGIDIPVFEVAEPYFHSFDRLQKLRHLTFKDGNEDYFPLLTRIEPGFFMIGSSQGEHDRDSFETPTYEANVRKPFAFGIFTVTRGQYAVFVDEEGLPPGEMRIWRDGDGWVPVKNKDWTNPGFAQTDHHPVVGVSHHDATRYCAWLTKRTGHIYRLPTETEWEYACRAGTTTPFSWGNDITPHQARYDHRETYYEGGVTAEFCTGTAPVDAYEPNPWGLYQMHGNVWEWCDDPWMDNYRSRAAGKPHLSRQNFGRAVVRGGAWLSVPCKLRSAKRDWDERDLRGNTVGFRVLREIDE